MTKSIYLIRNCQSFAETLNVRIFKQVSIFLRELSNDNEYIKGIKLDDINVLIEGSDALQVTADNIDFFWNLVEFQFNVITQKEGQVGVF